MYLVGWEVSIDHPEHVHHFLAYFCDSELPEGQQPGTDLRDELGCEALGAVWAAGTYQWVPPADVALPVGPGTGKLALTVEVHYDNPDRLSGVDDASTLTLHFTTSPREHDMAMLELGDQVLTWSNEIPAGEDSWFVASRSTL